jgi:hypothetical protein
VIPVKSSAKVHRQGSGGKKEQATVLSTAFACLQFLTAYLNSGMWKY